MVNRGDIPGWACTYLVAKRRRRQQFNADVVGSHPCKGHPSLGIVTDVKAAQTQNIVRAFRRTYRGGPQAEKELACFVGNCAAG
ncbi:hypothetical protein D3C76_1315090 [compost metagenome]